MFFLTAQYYCSHVDEVFVTSPTCSCLCTAQVTATIDWCETNYAWTYFIAEFWNTVRRGELCIEAKSKACFADMMSRFSQISAWLPTGF